MVFSEMYGLTEELLHSNQDVALKVGGGSMFPCLKPGDIITIKKLPSKELVSGDIIVFKQEKKWIAHRILRIELLDDSKLMFIAKGDTCKTEDAPLKEDDVVGKVVSYNRQGKTIILNKSKSNKNYNAGFFVLMRLWFIMLMAKINKNIRGIWHNIRFLTLESKKIFALNIVFSIITGALPLVIIYQMKWLVDAISHRATGNGDLGAFYPVYFIIGLIALAFLISAVLTIFNGFVREKLLQSVFRRVMDLLHKKYASLDMEYLENAEDQDKIHRAIQEAGSRPDKMISQFLALTQSVASWILIAVMLFSIHWSVFFLVLVAVIPGFWVRIQFAKAFYKFSKANSKLEREAYYYNRILTSLAFANEIRLFGQSNFFNKRFEKIQSGLHDKKNQLNRKRILPDVITQVFAVTLIFFSFGFVAYMAMKGWVSIGTVVLFFLIFQRGYAVMKDLFQSLAGLVEDHVFFQDFMNFLNLPSLRKAPKQEVVPEFLQTGIVLNKVSFQYPASKRNALQNISLTIPKGKTIALVGANGSGKTTLIKLLCGFYVPQKGSIHFDDTDISLIDSDILRKQIAVVFQDFALYNLTALENISLGEIAKPLSENEIKEAAKNAGMDDMLETLPNAYHTMLGNLFEKGEELSIGQWQKMAIAKAFYRDAPILMLDEPSSALDAETENVVLQNLQQLANNKTVIIVSHRFSTIKWADIIYVMEKGELIESGNHDHLMANKGRYFEMYSAGSMGGNG